MEAGIAAPSPTKGGYSFLGPPGGTTARSSQLNNILNTSSSQRSRGASVVGRTQSETPFYSALGSQGGQTARSSSVRRALKTTTSTPGTSATRPLPSLGRLASGASFSPSPLRVVPQSALTGSTQPLPALGDLLLLSPEEEAGQAMSGMQRRGTSSGRSTKMSALSSGARADRILARNIREVRKMLNEDAELIKRYNNVKSKPKETKKFPSPLDSLGPGPRKPRPLRRKFAAKGGRGSPGKAAPKLNASPKTHVPSPRRKVARRSRSRSPARRSRSPARRSRSPARRSRSSPKPVARRQRSQRGAGSGMGLRPGSLPKGFGVQDVRPAVMSRPKRSLRSTAHTIRSGAGIAGGTEDEPDAALPNLNPAKRTKRKSSTPKRTKRKSPTARATAAAAPRRSRASPSPKAPARKEVRAEKGGAGGLLPAAVPLGFMARLFGRKKSATPEGTAARARSRSRSRDSPLLEGFRARRATASAGLPEPEGRRAIAAAGSSPKALEKALRSPGWPLVKVGEGAARKRCPPKLNRGPGDLCYPKKEAALLQRVRKEIVAPKRARRQARRELRKARRVRRQARRKLGRLARRVGGKRKTSRAARIPSAVRRSLERGLSRPSSIVTPSGASSSSSAPRRRYSYRHLRKIYEGKRTAPTGMRARRAVYRKVVIRKRKKQPVTPHSKTLYRYRLSPV
jgi:hypothetical protein